MGFLGNDFWDDIVDINDKNRKRQKDWTPPPEKDKTPSSNNSKKNGVSGLTIFYRSLGSIILITTMIKSWFWSASLFDWVLLIVALLMIGLHRRLGAEAVIEKIKPAFLDLHNRLQNIETKLGVEDNLTGEKIE